MTLESFLASCLTLVNWIFGTVFPSVVSAITSNPIFLAFIIAGFVSTIAFIVLDLVLTAIGQ